MSILPVITAYDIYVKYQRYTDNVIASNMEIAPVYVSLTVYDTPEATLIKPSVGVYRCRGNSFQLVNRK